VEGTDASKEEASGAALRTEYSMWVPEATFSQKEMITAFKGPQSAAPTALLASR
jgi:hypothetical protein